MNVRYLSVPTSPKALISEISVPRVSGCLVSNVLYHTNLSPLVIIAGQTRGGSVSAIASFLLANDR